MADGKFVVYRRTSKVTQMLGLDAQQEMVNIWLNGGRHEVIGSFVEQETGKRNDRPELMKALALCKKRKATLVIAVLDRLSRNSAFINNLLESGVEFVACDNPNASKLTIRVLAAVAQDEVERISIRTKRALAVKKAQGALLGNRTNLNTAQARGRAVQASQAQQFAENIHPLIQQVRAAGVKTLREIAGALNARGIKTARGGEWSAAQVKFILDRVEA